MIDGEIITEAKMREAGERRKEVEAVIASNPNLAAALTPTKDYLLSVEYLGWR